MSKYIIVLLLFIAPVSAQEFNQAKMDSLFSLIEQNNKGMGSYSIFSDGKEIYQKSFGYAQVSGNKKANSLTKYRIGSITKTYTAVLIMQLIEEGKIKFNTSLSEHFPKIPNASKITVQSLLKHESGLFNITSDENISEWKSESQSRDQMIGRIIKNGTVFQPNEKTEYSNTNFILLSYIAENIEGKAYADILQSRIFTPLDLKRTAFGSKIDPTNNEAFPYDYENDQWQLIENQTDLSGPMGAGGIVATPTEINVFFNALFADRLVSEASLSAMKDATQGVGMGLMKLPLGAMEVYGHGGSIDGFQSFTAYFPKEKVSFSMTTNNLYTQISNVFIGAVQIYFGMDYKLPDFSPVKTIALSTEDLDKYLGTYSSPEFPIDITISKEGTVLLAQGEGQASFPVTATEKDIFYSEEVMITLKFNADQGKMTVEQGGQTFVLTRD